MKQMDAPAVEAPAGVVDAAVGELATLIRHGRRKMGARPRPDVSMAHLQVLIALDAEGDVPMSRIAETLLCSFPNATGIVDRMEDRGYVERLRDERDRRVVLVRITPAGRAALGELESMRQQYLHRLLSAMSADDQRLCLKAFRRIRETAERLDLEIKP